MIEEEKATIITDKVIITTPTKVADVSHVIINGQSYDTRMCKGFEMIWDPVKGKPEIIFHYWPHEPHKD